MSNINKEEKGSITVEAAFVMPIVILTVFALIYLAFYLHDYNRIQGIVDLVIHKAGITIKHDADIATGRISYEDINDRGVFYTLTGDLPVEESKIGKLLDQELSKGLFITHIIKAEVEAGKLDIKINVLAKTHIGLPLFQNAFNKLLNINVESTYPVHNPAETVRACEVILDTGSKIKGADKLKDVLEKFTKTK
jgi:hypothetical protein